MMSNSKEFYNKKARFDYIIEEDIEAGVELKGPEIKAIRGGKLTMVGTYAKILSGELFWIGANINNSDVDNNRSRRLLVHKSELNKIIGKLEQKNFTLVPLKGYFKRGKFKLLLGLGKGKKSHDKRETIKRRENDRELARKIRRVQGQLVSRALPQIFTTDRKDGLKIAVGIFLQMCLVIVEAKKLVWREGREVEGGTDGKTPSVIHFQLPISILTSQPTTKLPKPHSSPPFF